MTASGVFLGEEFCRCGAWLDCYGQSDGDVRYVDPETGEERSRCPMCDSPIGRFSGLAESVITDSRRLAKPVPNPKENPDG